MSSEAKKCLTFIKDETVLSISSVLAIFSMFLITPDREYIDYIDFRTLAILFCLMTVMAGFQNLGVFKLIANQMLAKVHSLWQLLTILIMLCFFFSMLITNDVALITFVPLTLTVINMLDIAEKRKWIIPIVVMQTIAANLGSMLTPIGNPQNLYLYSISGMSIVSFLILMLPYAVCALALLLLWSLTYCRKRNAKLTVPLESSTFSADKKLIHLYSILFLMSLLVVVHILPCYPVMFFVLFCALVMDRKTLTKVDYSLLLTFVAFFLFIGNMGRVTVFKDFLESMIQGHEALTAVIASQIISNVPAALLLSGFTDRINALIVGTNLGGLGTLIASMASLISFKYIAQYDKQLCGSYLTYFTVANTGFLAILLGLFLVLYN